MWKVMILLISLFLLIGIKILQQDLISPASINTLWNMFFIFGAVFIFGTEITWYYTGVIWLLLSCFVFLLGQKIGVSIKIQKRDKRDRKGRKYVGLILLSLILLGTCNSIMYIKAFEYSFWDLFDIQSLLKLNTEVAYDRYYGHVFNPPSISVIFSIAIYSGALIGGYLFPFTQKKILKLLSLMTLFPILLLAIITNGKVGVIACAFLWCTGWIVYTLGVKGSGRIITPRIVILGVVIIPLGVLFLDLTMLMRIGSIDWATQRIVNKKLQEYAFGQIESFAYWFAQTEHTTLDLGSNTYMFLSNWLGLTVRQQGVYDLIPGLSSNIFTQSRGIIMDYGVCGSFVYWMLLGILSGFVYKRVKQQGDKTPGGQVILGTIYFQMLHGFMVSPWIYSSYVLSFLAFWLFLLFIKKVK